MSEYFGKKERKKERKKTNEQANKDPLRINRS